MSVRSTVYPVLLQNGRLPNRRKKFIQNEKWKASTGKMEKTKKIFNFLFVLWTENGNGNDFAVCGGVTCDVVLLLRSFVVRSCVATGYGLFRNHRLRGVQVVSICIRLNCMNL